MSNKRCPRCGKTYPSSYRTCPYCSGQSGQSSRRRRRPEPETPLEQIAAFLRENGERIFLGCTALFLVIAVLGSILTQCSSREDPAPTPDNSAQPPEEENNDPLTEPLAISTPTIDLYVDEHAALSVTGGPEDTVNVWTTSDPAVVTVEDGIVTALATGTATITATRGTEQVYCVVTVKEKDPDVEVYLNRTDFTLSTKYPSFQMEVKVRETKKKYEGGVIWSIEDPSVATVDETGLVERVSKGTTKVTATMGTKVLECIVRVS